MAGGSRYKYHTSVLQGVGEVFHTDSGEHIGEEDTVHNFKRARSKLEPSSACPNASLLSSSVPQ